MEFFLVRDHQEKYRFFSSEPEKDITIPVSRTKRAWQLAQKKLTLLPPRILRQEQAFIHTLKIGNETIRIRYSGLRSEKRIRLRFSLFLYRQRTRHILLLIGEALLLPLSGLAALLPGPNVAFAALAILMYTHWQALRGIYRLSRKRLDFVAATLLADWETACSQGQVDRFAELLKRIESEFRLSKVNKVLWK
jgi:hypothetical protein